MKFVDEYRDPVTAQRIAREIAAMLRFIGETWLATERYQHALSLAQLTAAWRCACESVVLCWCTARGR